MERRSRPLVACRWLAARPLVLHPAAELLLFPGAQPIRAAIGLAGVAGRSVHALGIQQLLVANLGKTKEAWSRFIRSRYRFQIEGFCSVFPAVWLPNARFGVGNDRSGLVGTRTARRRRATEAGPGSPQRPCPGSRCLPIGGGIRMPQWVAGCAHRLGWPQLRRGRLLRRNSERLAGRSQLPDVGIAPAGRNLAADLSCPSMTCGLWAENGGWVASPVASSGARPLELDLASRRWSHPAAAIHQRRQRPQF